MIGKGFNSPVNIGRKSTGEEVGRYASFIFCEDLYLNVLISIDRNFISEYYPVFLPLPNMDKYLAFNSYKIPRFEEISIFCNQRILVITSQVHNNGHSLLYAYR